MSDVVHGRIDQLVSARITEAPDAKCWWWKGTWHSYGELGASVDAFEATLRAAGFARGQRLVAMMPNCPAVLALSVATWRLGGTFCPLNEKSGALSLVKTLDLLDPFAVVVSEGVKAELTDELARAGWPVVVCPTEGPLPAFEGKASPRPDDEELAVIFSTSGTTGDPKAVPLTHANLIDDCRACDEHLIGLTSDDVFLNVLPNFHAFGFTVAMLLPFSLGASQVIVPGFMPPQDTLRAILEARPNILLLVPTMLGFLTGLVERKGQIIDWLKFLITGGDRYNAQMDERVAAAFGVPVVEGYGITECSPVLSVNRDHHQRRLGTVGRPLPRFETKLCAEDGSPALGDEGVLWVRGPAVTSGYYRAPELNGERFHDGWFNTGDYVRMEDGFIKILDRVTDIVIVGGFNVYPQEVEAILSEHPAVQTAVVVGKPNDISGEVPKAFVLLKEGETVGETELIKFCKARLSHYKVPRDVEIVTELPLSSTGKVLRRVLRQRERDAKD